MADEEQQQQPPFVRRQGKEVVLEEDEDEDEDEDSDSSSSISSSSSTTNPEELNLSFEITPIKAVKKALRILQNEDLNHAGGRVLAVVSADRRFEISAQNMLTGVVATVVFQGDDLQNFLCNQPLLPPQIELSVPWFHLFFNDIRHAHRTITFFQRREDSPHTLYIGLVTTDGHVDWARPGDLKPPLWPYPPEPSTSAMYFCDVSIDYTTLNEIIPHIQTDPQQVSVEVKRNRATISTNGQSWNMACEDRTSRKKHHALFELWHLESLRMASSEAPGAVLCLPAPPSDQIMIRIFLERLGVVDFHFNALELSTVSDEDSPGGDTAEPSRPHGDAAEASQPSGDATETSQSGGVATEALQPGSDANEASEPRSDAAKAPKPGGDAVEASQPGCDAAEASQTSGNAAETLQPDDVAIEALQLDSDADEALQSDTDADEAS